MKQTHLWISLVAVALFAVSAIADDDLLGKDRNRGGSGKGSGSGTSSGSGSSGPRNDGGTNGSRGPEAAPRPRSDRGSGPSGFDRQEPPITSSSRNPSRSGTVRYGTQNNRGRQGEAPSISWSSGDAARQARREEDVRARPSWRSGYNQYDSRFRDDSFRYPYYSFDRTRDCVPSPWYGYSHLPAYVSQWRVTLGVGPIQFRYIEDVPWRWTNRYDSRSDSYRVDQSVADWVRVFERQDLRALNNLIPRRGRVVVSSGGWSPYAMATDDFYDLVADLATSSRTVRYRIESVRRGRDGLYEVNAVHEYTDPWSRRAYAGHRLLLEDDGRGVDIVEFASFDAR